MEHFVGIGLVDNLTDTNINFKTGEAFAPLGVINDERYDHLDPSLPKVLYVIRANAEINTEMHSYFYTQVTSGHCVFLAHEREVRARLMSTKRGQRMKPEKRAEFLLPYEMTTRLFDEISNLKIKNNIKTLEVERISSRIFKDRFSAFEMGLYRIRDYEIDYYKRKKRESRDVSKMVLFTPHGKKTRR